MSSSSRTPSPYYVTHLSSVIDYDDDYQRGAFQNNSKDPLTSAMMLLARAITQRFSNPTNNRLRTSSNTRNQAIMQADKRTLRTTSSRSATNVQCYISVRKDEAGVTFTDEQNDFFIVDATRMEEIKELSSNICLMARIQPTNIDSDAGPSYDYALLSEVQKPSTNYVNLLFAKDNQEQKYSKQPKYINDTIGDDKIDSNIIFDEPNVDVNSGTVEYDNNVQASYELEQLARNAYKEAEKQQINANKIKQQNKVLTQQLELYKEKADSKAMRLEKVLQTQFIRDRDIIRDLEQKLDNLQLSVVELKRQIVELQKTQTILKRKMSENEDKYHDIVLDLEAKAKDNENVVLKIGYENPYTLKKAISQNPKIYDASCFNDMKIHVNVRDTEDILNDATKSQIKMENKLKDPIAIEKKQNVRTIDYNN
ncbi:hypothetical protein Tco_1222159 [Tanacetum coccineum]